MTIAIPRLTRVPADERGLTIGDFLVPIRLGESVGARTRHVFLILAGVLFIYLAAQLRFYPPGNPVPITGQTFAVLLVGGALGFRRGLLSVLLYVLLGSIGLPLFAGSRGGIEVLLGVTGGYLAGFIVAGALVGRLAELGWDRRLGGAIGAMALGNMTIYAVALPWLAVVTGSSASMAIQTGLLPFVVGDLLKLLLAAVMFPAAWWVVGRRPDDR